jgi:ABC-2 type transport system permease protein
MSLRTVVEGDLLDVRRSRLGQSVALCLVLMTGGIVALVALAAAASPPEVQAPQFDPILLVIGYVLSFLLPFVAMLASYSAIIHERDQGSIRFLLGLPNSRLDAYAGKYVSRSALLVGSLVVGLVVTLAVGIAVLREPSIGAFLTVAALTLVYGLLFIGFGLAISSNFSTETRVTSGIISVYVGFRAGWMALQWGLLRVTQPRGERFVQPHPEWYYWLGRLNPMNAYNKLLESTLTDDQFSPVLTTPQIETAATSDWFALVVLLGWTVAVPVLGYLGFRGRDVL